MIKKVLLTGASGFIGSYITEILREKKIDFLNISNMLGDYKYPDKTVLLPLYDIEGLKTEIEKFKPDAVIHMAAISSPAHKITGEIYDVNVSGTENLLEAVKKTCKKGIRVILFSSGTVYGNQDKDYFEENDPLKPANHYSCSKAVMEYLSYNYNDCIDIRIVRPFNIIGAGQSENFLVPKLVKAFNERVVELSLGNLQAVRDYVSIDFAAAAVIEYLFYDKNDCPVLNICSGKGYSVQDVFDTLVRITGHKPEIKVSQEIVRNNEIWRLVGSSGKLEKIMGKHKTPDLETILRKMLDNSKKHVSNVNINNTEKKEKSKTDKNELSSVVISRAKDPDKLIELLISLKEISDEVVLLLESADDNSRKTFNKYADKICKIEEKGSSDAYYRNILKNCTKDWILNIDEKETLSNNFTRKILNKYIINNEMTAFFIPRKWYINNNEYICTDPWYPDYQPRLFRRIEVDKNIPNNIIKNTQKIDEIHVKNWNLIDSIDERIDKDKYYKIFTNDDVCELYYYEDKNYDKAAWDILNYPVLNNRIKAFLPKEMKLGVNYGINVLIYINNYDVINIIKNNKEVYFSYHWYNEDKSIYLWDSIRETVNETAKECLFSSIIQLRLPDEKGKYFLQVDIVEERKQWLCNNGLINSDLVPVNII